MRTILVLVLVACGSEKTRPVDNGVEAAKPAPLPAETVAKPSTYDRPAGPEKPSLDDDPPPPSSDADDDIVAMAPPPPPPPPPPRVVPKDVVQPKKLDKQPVDPDDEEDGVEGGVVGGVVGGDLGGGGAPPPPPPPPPATQNVPPTSLEANRIGGDKAIAPDDATKTEIGKSGKERVIGSFKLCVDASGNVQSIRTLKSTGFGGYDAKILREMRSWRYRPFMVNGKAVPVCTAITFIYTQRP